MKIFGENERWGLDKWVKGGILHREIHKEILKLLYDFLMEHEEIP